MREVLTPSYYEKFSCIGNACEDTCCSGWRVAIDDYTKIKYKEVTDQELKPMLENTKEYFELSDNGNCSFLSDEKLCKIQLNLGESYLSNTCFLYPRNFNELNGVLEASACVSCPEVARLVLLDPDSMKFEKSSKDIETRGSIKHLGKQKNYEQIRGDSIKILQDREYSISERLLIWGMFLQDDNADQLPKYISEGKQIYSEFPTTIEMQIDFLKTFLDLLGEGGKGHERYKECARESMEWLDLANGVQLAATRYRDAYEKFYRPYIKNHEYTLENYLVNYLYGIGFPYSKTSIYDQYMITAVFYSLIKFHLICLSGSNKGLNDELVVKLIQSFSKRFEHNPNTIKIIDYMKTCGFVQLSHFMMLIKN